MSRQISKCDVQKLACICDILECTDVTAEQLQGLLPNTYIVDDIDILVQVHPAEHMYVMVTQQAMAAFGRWMLQELDAKTAELAKRDKYIAELQEAFNEVCKFDKRLDKLTAANLDTPCKTAMILELQKQLREQATAKRAKPSFFDKLKNLFK